MCYAMDACSTVAHACELRAPPLHAQIHHSTIIHSTDGTDARTVWEPLPLYHALTVQHFEGVLHAQNNLFSELEKNLLNAFGCARCPWNGDFLSMKVHLHFA